MSTKPDVLVNAGLCAAHFPMEVQEVIANKSLLDSSATISVRPLSLSADIPAIYRWVTQEHPGDRWSSAGNPLRELEEAYASIIRSNFAQPFMGLINGAPVCQLDIYQTRQDSISLCYAERPGDYGLHLLLAPLCVQDQVAVLLQTFLEYFFSFPEVTRIVTDVEIGNEWMNRLFKKAGFLSSGKIQLPYKTAHLYICTRASLLTTLSASN